MLRVRSIRKSPGRALLKLPLVVGALVEASARTQFSRIFSTMLTAGIAPLSAIRLATETITNLHSADAVRAAQRVATSVKIETQMGETGAIQTELLTDINIGEEGGRLPEQMELIADDREFVDQEVEVAG